MLPFNLYRLASIANAAVFAAGCMIAGGVSAAPNVVLVLLDDVDHRTAATADILPRIQQRLGAEGATLKRAYAQHGPCTSSRATILTGLYSQNTQVRRNKPPFGGFETYRAGACTSARSTCTCSGPATAPA